MDFGIVGPIEVRDGDRVLAVGGPKPRALLAMLLVRANETVSAERLAMGLWGEDAAADAIKALHVHVSRVRKALGGGDVLVTSGGGYRLKVLPGELDLERFERLAAAPEIARLEEQRLAVLEARVEADLAAGRHAELVGELQQLTAAHPARHEQIAWTRRIDGEAANVRRALERARGAGDAELVLRIITALDEWWFARGLWVEGCAWLEWALDRAGDDVPAGLRAAGWQAVGYLLWAADEHEQRLDAAARAWALASEAGDPVLMAWAQVLRSHIYIAEGDQAHARSAAEEAVRLARGLDDLTLGGAYRVLSIELALAVSGM